MVMRNKKIKMLLIAMIFFGGFFANEETFASDNKTDLSINISPVLTVELNYNPINIEADGVLRTGVLNLMIDSNNRTGVTATMTTTSESTEENATSLVHEYADDSILTLEDEVAMNDFPLNRWGYSIDGGANFKPIRAKDEESEIVFLTTSSADYSQKDILIGTRSDMEKTAGTYKNTILVTVVPNYVVMSFDEAFMMAGKRTYGDTGLYSMQDMSQDVCGIVSTNEEAKVVDVRDNKTYWIAKLADGHCWMTQNLDFNLSTSVTLTNATTDLNSVTSWKPARNTVARGSLTSSNFPTSSAAYNAPYSYDEDEYYYYEAPAADGVLDSSDKAEIYSMLDDCVAVGHTREKCEHYHSGNIYNWSAAVASNGTSGLKTNGAVARDSICPKGWRLPMLYTARNESTGVMETSESIDLFNAYGMSHENSKGLSMEPFYFVRAGAIYNLNGNIRQEVGVGTRYWTSTVFDWAVVYFYGNSPSNIVERNVGQSIRCIAR